MLAQMSVLIVPLGDETHSVNGRDEFEIAAQAAG